jgi:HAD superfamily hydrolase (TIGR01549 family)
MRYQLVCLDAGFTLIAPIRTTAATLAAILAEEGIPPTEEALRRAWDAADRWFWEEYHRPGNDTWTSDERIRQTWRHHHGLMLRELGVDDRDMRLVDAVIAAYNLEDNWQIFPDVLPTLAALRRPGRTIGIVSDWSTHLDALLDRLDLRRQLDFVLVSATAGAAKPSPELYRQALAEAGAAPHQAIMVGDSYTADVLGARSAGIDGVLLDRQSSHPAVDVPVIHTLAELPALVD